MEVSNRVKRVKGVCHHPCFLDTLSLELVCHHLSGDLYFGLKYSGISLDIGERMGLSSLNKQISTLSPIFGSAKSIVSLVQLLFMLRKWVCELGEGTNFLDQIQHILFLSHEHLSIQRHLVPLIPES